jgi:hypothetical protein
MARRPMPWWRFYGEMMRDSKLRLRPVAERWAWAAVCTIANESPERGFLLVDGESATVEAIADLAALPVKDVKVAYAYFRQKEMVLDDERGIPFVTQFRIRNPDSDSSSQRTAKWRHKNGGSDVTTGDEETDSLSESLLSQSLEEREAAALRLIADRRRAKLDGVLDIEAWSAKVVDTLRRTHARKLADAPPNLTAEQLADLLEPGTKPSPILTAEESGLSIKRRQIESSLAGLRKMRDPDLDAIADLEQELAQLDKDPANA